MQWAAGELERTVAAFDGDQIVGTGRNYSLELTLPGNAVIPASGVSWISVLPDAPAPRHPALDDGLPPRGGRAPRRVRLDADRVGGRHLRALRLRGRDTRAEHPRRAATTPSSPRPSPKAGCDSSSRRRARRSRRSSSSGSAATRPGAVSRPSFWWPGEWVPKEHAKNRFDVIYELDGRVEGYAVYNIEGTWTDGFSEKTVGVHDLVAATPGPKPRSGSSCAASTSSPGSRTGTPRPTPICPGCWRTRARCAPVATGTGCGSGRSTPPRTSAPGATPPRAGSCSR